MLEVISTEVERAALVSPIAKRYYIVSSSGMVVWNLLYLFLRYLVPVYMAVSIVVIDTQEALAFRKRAFSAFSRSL
jgi:hypothetical protein